MTDSENESFINDAELEEFTVPIFLYTTGLQKQAQNHFLELPDGWDDGLFTGKEHLLRALDEMYDRFIPAYYLGDDYTESKQTQLDEKELQVVFSEREWTSLAEFKVLYFEYLSRLSKALPDTESRIEEFYDSLSDFNYSISYNDFKNFCQEGLPSELEQEYEQYKDNLQDYLLPVSIDTGTVWCGSLQDDSEDREIKIEVIEFKPPFDEEIRAYSHPFPIGRVLESEHPEYPEGEELEFPVTFFTKKSQCKI